MPELFTRSDGLEYELYEFDTEHHGPIFEFDILEAATLFSVVSTFADSNLGARNPAHQDYLDLLQAHASHLSRELGPAIETPTPIVITSESADAIYQSAKTIGKLLSENPLAVTRWRQGVANMTISIMSQLHDVDSRLFETIDGLEEFTRGNDGAVTYLDGLIQTVTEASAFYHRAGGFN